MTAAAVSVQRRRGRPGTRRCARSGDGRTSAASAHRRTRVRVHGCTSVNPRP
ncbi:hypothetical protein SGM_0379 [Streptomyces griseoaurantiacus M045]|uniref:Uncharacterized protein n=1 Tax=Streptomyces griseoaurantiacus M045 TaxID=996637 RepID=F3NAJ5_9ACTN|nr:hypothetical protein SGM_0379 [Streptomyces griseoaurantiacus M045]